MIQYRYAPIQNNIVDVIADKRVIYTVPDNVDKSKISLRISNVGYAPVKVSITTDDESYISTISSSILNPNAAFTICNIDISTNTKLSVQTNASGIEFQLRGYEFIRK